MQRSGKKCRNNKTVSLAGSQAECEGRVQIKRRIGDLEVSQSDFAVFFFTPPSPPPIYCQCQDLLPESNGNSLVASVPIVKKKKVC